MRGGADRALCESAIGETARGLSSGMTILLVGIGILGSVLALFYFKDRFESPRLGRLAYSEIVMRLTVIAVILIVIGMMLVLNKMLT
jgi:uncharacterized membrane protein YidH (DUF202 family)